MTSFGDRLRELRIEKNLTQEELATNFGLHKTRISQYELNKRQADDEMKKKLAQFFNVSLDWLMGLTNTRNYKEISNILLIDEPDLSLHQKVALKFADQLTKDGYELEENDLNDLLLVSKFTLEQKKNKK